MPQVIIIFWHLSYDTMSATPPSSHWRKYFRVPLCSAIEHTPQACHIPFTNFVLVRTCFSNTLALVLARTCKRAPCASMCPVLPKWNCWHRVWYSQNHLFPFSRLPWQRTSLISFCFYLASALFSDSVHRQAFHCVLSTSEKQTSTDIMVILTFSS